MLSAALAAALESVSQKHKITAKVILSRSKERYATLPRQEVYYVLAAHTDMSIADIASIMERDRSTVLQGIRAHITREMAKPPASPQHNLILAQMGGRFFSRKKH